jgi:hypothetical protein
MCKDIINSKAPDGIRGYITLNPCRGSGSSAGIEGDAGLTRVAALRQAQPFDSAQDDGWVSKGDKPPKSTI